MFYSIYQSIRLVMGNKKRKRFDEQNTVLNQKSIEELLQQEDVHNTLEVLRSAVVDHKKVGGNAYYTDYPPEMQLGHDGFRRATIADGIGNYACKMEKEDLFVAVKILDKLTDINTERKYTQILAWNSLGRIVKNQPSIIDHEKVRELFNYSVASSVGALLFLDQMLDTSRQEAAKNLIIEGTRSARYTLTRVLFCYYANKKQGFGNPVEKYAKDFFKAIQKGYRFDQDDFNEGLRQIGMSVPFWENTGALRIAERLYSIYICRDLIAAIGASWRQDFENKKNYDLSCSYELPIEK